MLMLPTAGALLLWKVQLAIINLWQANTHSQAEKAASRKLRRQAKGTLRAIAASKIGLAAVAPPNCAYGHSRRAYTI